MDDPEQLVQAIAVAKADAVVEQVAAKDPCGLTQGIGLLVLTSDQVVTYEGAIREKPADMAEARRFIESYSSAPCGTVGGCETPHLSIFLPWHIYLAIDHGVRWTGLSMLTTAYGCGGAG